MAPGVLSRNVRDCLATGGFPGCNHNAVGRALLLPVALRGRLLRCQGETSVA